MALANGPTTLLEHASHPHSPWHMQSSYNGYPRGISDPEHIMKLSAEIRAPPYYRWSIDGCGTSLRVTPGQWYRVAVLWNKKTLTLFINDNLCSIANPVTFTIKATAKQQLSTRHTHLVFTDEQRIKDFIFNGGGDYPTFFHSDYLANNKGELRTTVVNQLKDFYASFRLVNSIMQTSVYLPGVDGTIGRVEGKLIVDLERQKCTVFSLPPACITDDSCGVEVERQGSSVVAYSQNLPLSTVDDARLCNMARQNMSQSGLVSNSQVRVFNRGRNELLKRRLILSGKHINLIFTEEPRI